MRAAEAMRTSIVTVEEGVSVAEASLGMYKKKERDALLFCGKGSRLE